MLRTVSFLLAVQAVLATTKATGPKQTEEGKEQSMSINLSFGPDGPVTSGHIWDGENGKVWGQQSADAKELHKEMMGGDKLNPIQKIYQNKDRDADTSNEDSVDADNVDDTAEEADAETDGETAEETDADASADSDTGVTLGKEGSTVDASTRKPLLKDDFSDEVGPEEKKEDGGLLGWLGCLFGCDEPKADQAMKEDTATAEEDDETVLVKKPVEGEQPQMRSVSISINDGKVGATVMNGDKTFTYGSHHEREGGSFLEKTSAQKKRGISQHQLGSDKA